jgi:hypothetical protein
VVVLSQTVRHTFRNPFPNATLNEIVKKAMIKSSVRESIERATQAFEQCWELLAAMKEGSISLLNEVSVVDFQPRLAKAISELSETYRKLAQEKERSIERKDGFSRPWFLRKMRTLNEQQELIIRTILVGRGIGDGFAWFFYQNNRNYLTEHLKESEQLISPPGVGGYAELEVIRNLRIVQGCFLLYHGITSILRLGDFSLIDLKSFRVRAVGEIKAGQPLDGKMEVSLIFPIPDGSDASVLPKRDKLISSKPHSPRDAISQFTAKARDRLNRQMARMANSYSKIESRPDKKLSMEIENRMAEFDNFVLTTSKDKFKFLKFGSGLLLAGLRVPNKSLYTRLTSKSIGKSLACMEGVQEQASLLIAPHRSDNALFVGAWFYHKENKLRHKPGMTHPIWWPVSGDAMKQVLFQEVLIFTILNPAHLFALLEEVGYSVNVEFPNKYTVDKIVGDGKFTLEGMTHYFEMMQQYLFVEHDIVEFLCRMEKEAFSSSTPHYKKIELHIQQHFGRP